MERVKQQKAMPEKGQEEARERNEESRKERSKEKKEETRRGVRIERDKTHESQLCLAGTFKEFTCHSWQKGSWQQDTAVMATNSYDTGFLMNFNCMLQDTI